MLSTSVPSVGACSGSADANGQSIPAHNPGEQSNAAAIERLRRQGIEITQAELDRTLELTLRQKQGEYVLLLERPLSRKVDERAREDLAEELERQDGPEYDRIFKGLGLTAEASDRLKLHVFKIARAALEAEAATHQLLRARNDYDKTVRSWLSADDYARYRQMEAGRPALREFEKLDAFYRRQVDKNVGLEYQPIMVSLIQEAGTYTESPTCYRPYDGLPGITIGTEAVLQKLERERTDLTEGLGNLREQACQSGLPEEYQQLLTDYFEEAIQKKSELILSLRQEPGREPAAGLAHDNEDVATE